MVWPPPLALVKLNRWWASAMDPSAGPSYSLKYWLKWSCYIKLTILPESSSEGTDSPIIFSSTLGHLATGHFIILNWVCIDFTLTLVSGQISVLSCLGKGCEPFTFSPLSRFFFNGVWGVMTPQLQYSTWLHICRLIYFEATYNCPVHVQCLYNTGMSSLYLGTHLTPLMVWVVWVSP